MIKFNVKTKFNAHKISRRADKANRAAQMQLDEDVLKDSNFYIPMETGNLMESGILNTIIGSGEIVWNTPYARRLYYNPQYNFSNDVNPHAQGLWFEAAKALHKEDWLSDAKEKYSDYFKGR